MSEERASAPVTTSTVAVHRRSQLSASTLRDLGILLVPVLLFVLLAMASQQFLTVENLLNVVNRSVAVGLIAAAGTLVIVAGGFDLSAGSIFAVAAVLGALVSNTFGAWPGITAGLLAGCTLGLINGLLVGVGRVDHLVGTLGTMIAYGGLAIAIGGSGVILITDPAFGAFATTPLLGVRLSSWYLVIFFLVCAFLLNLTVFGRRIFAVGGNPAAARLSGVSVNRTLIGVYVLSGFAAALAGLVTAGASFSTRATSGSMLMFDALAAILIGGNSIRGGRGAMWRTLVGVATLVLISNGFNLMGIDPIYQQIVTGGIILIAVTADVWTRRRTT